MRHCRNRATRSLAQWERVCVYTCVYFAMLPLLLTLLLPLSFLFSLLNPCSIYVFYVNFIHFTLDDCKCRMCWKCLANPMRFAYSSHLFFDQKFHFLHILIGYVMKYLIFDYVNAPVLFWMHQLTKWITEKSKALKIQAQCNIFQFNASFTEILYTLCVYVFTVCAFWMKRIARTQLFRFGAIFDMMMALVYRWSETTMG